jgi:hypothetical protein
MPQLISLPAKDQQIGVKALTVGGHEEVLVRREMFMSWASLMHIFYTEHVFRFLFLLRPPTPSPTHSKGSQKISVLAA